MRSTSPIFAWKPTVKASARITAIVPVSQRLPPHPHIMAKCCGLVESKGEIMDRAKYRAWNEDHFIYSDDKWENEYPNDGDGWFGFESGVLKAWVSETITPSDPLEAPYPSSEELESPIEQFTDLKDKDGKDLDWWEGDLLSTFRYTEYETLWEIVYENGCFWACQVGTSQRKITAYELSQYADPAEKRGSIHDNPEPTK